MDENLCPECNGRMVSRQNTRTGQRFWGCANYPTCKGTRNTDGEANTRDRDRQLAPSERAFENDRQRWRQP